MDVEVLGVMHNANGPKGDIILVRLHGSKPEYTGVVAGMSGSRFISTASWPGAGLSHWRILKGTDRRRDPDRGDARDQCAGSYFDTKSDTGDAAGQRCGRKSSHQNATAQTASPGERASVPAQSYSNYLTPSKLLSCSTVFPPIHWSATHRNSRRRESFR